MNVGTFLTKAALAHPARTALRFGSVQLTFAELNDAADRFGTGLLAAGCARGDRVAIYMGNNVEYVIALFGIFKAGLVAVPVNVKLHPKELEFIVADCGCRALLIEGDPLGALRPVLARFPDLLSVVVGTGGTFGEPFEAIVAAGHDKAPTAPVAPDDLAWIFYTSGTTGRPKGAMLSHRNLVSMTLNLLADVVSFQPEDVVFHAAPLSHGSGLYILGSLARASDNILHDASGFVPDEVLELIERERVTAIAFLAPTMIVRLLDGSKHVDTSSLRAVIYGGAPIHLDHAKAALARFGKVFVQIYGQGEAPMTISSLRAEDHDPADEEGLSSAGIIRTDVDVHIVGEDGVQLAAGEVGEIAVSGDVVMSGYWGDPEATATSLRDGWLHTGDIGRFDQRGRLHLLDRKNDLIISGGSNIYPREVEEVLVLHPAVREAAVFGVPDPEWGESVAAAVVPMSSEIEPAELIEHCRQHLASFKKPKHVEIVSQLPKSAYGKVLRRQLRDAFVNSQEVKG